MALVPSVLVQSLAHAFATPFRSAEEAVAVCASAYGTYARSAQAAVAVWVPTGAEEARLRARLASAYVPDGSPGRMAEAWASGLAAFWTLPPVIFGGGAVTAFPGYSALVQALVPLFSNSQNAGTIAASSLASALDLATRSVVVTLPVIGPTPLV